MEKAREREKTGKGPKRERKVKTPLSPQKMQKGPVPGGSEIGG